MRAARRPFTVALPAVALAVVLVGCSTAGTGTPAPPSAAPSAAAPSAAAAPGSGITAEPRVTTVDVEIGGFGETVPTPVPS
jgi:hypothetical protein